MRGGHAWSEHGERPRWTRLHGTATETTTAGRHSGARCVMCDHCHSASIGSNRIADVDWIESHRCLRGSYLCLLMLLLLLQVAMVGFQLPMLPAHKMRAPSVDDQADSAPPPPPPEASEQTLPTVDEQPQQQQQQQRAQPPQLPTSAAGGPPPMRAGPPPLPRGAGPPPLPQGQQQPAPQHDATAAAAPSSAQRAASPVRSQLPPQPRNVSPQRAQPPPQPKPTSPPTLPQQAYRVPPPMPTGPAPIAAAASAPAPVPAAAPASVVSAAIAAPPSLPPPQTAEERDVARSMLTVLLEELSPSVFTRKKEALDTFDQYYFKIRPTFTPEQVRSLLYGCTPAAPNELHKGLLALCGFTSWKSKKLKKAAG